MFGVSAVYWQGVSMVSGAAEPWDSPAYGIAYLVALAIALAAGLVIGRAAWLIGLAISFAQIPVMLWNGDGAVGNMAAAGLIILAALTLPLIGVAALGTIIRKRRAR
ncbi:hypothetical protein [Croceibacterium mercuriale]|uniref:hypothetical protein n=1 Tax=Croceibacterium mercuriale TaxID=1572751 RepID=UPI00126A19B9|nr:hypothetical protein [Croceibacterium mercuriale]